LRIINGVITVDPTEVPRVDLLVGEPRRELEAAAARAAAARAVNEVDEHVTPSLRRGRGVPLLGRVHRIHVRAVDDPVAAADVPPESLGRLTGEAPVTAVLAHIAGQVADGGG